MILYHSGTTGSMRPQEKPLLPEVVPPDATAVLLRGRARLITFADFASGSLNAVDLERFAAIHSDLALDSGAFSVSQGNADISIKSYGEFLLQWEHLFRFVANLDVIGDPGGSQRNQEELEAMGCHPLPIFHLGSPMEYLEAMCERYGYIGLGGMASVVGSPGERRDWITKCFKVIPSDVGVHGFGVGDALVREFPWRSVDSTNWLAAARFGRWPPFHSGVYSFAARILPWLEYLDGLAAAVGSEYDPNSLVQDSLFDVSVLDRERDKEQPNLGPIETCWPTRLDLDWPSPRLAVLFLGQAPSSKTDPEEPLSGQSGKRLAGLLGMSSGEYLDRVPRENLLKEWPGALSGDYGGDGFDVPAGRAAAREILSRELAGIRVVAMGRCVAGALGLPSDQPFFKWAKLKGCEVAVAPHPSGNNQWWNDPENTRLAVEFYGELAGQPNHPSGIDYRPKPSGPAAPPEPEPPAAPPTPQLPPREPEWSLPTVAPVEPEVIDENRCTCSPVTGRSDACPRHGTQGE